MAKRIARNRYAPQNTLQEIIAAENEVIRQLYAAGFIDYGQTDERVEHTESGIEVRLGGRKRYVLPNTTIRATVGRVKTCFYFLTDGEPTFLAKLPTLDVKTISKKIRELTRI